LYFGIFFPGSAIISNLPNHLNHLSMTLKNQKLAYIYASLVVLFWGTSATAFKIGLRYFSTVQLLFWSSLTASIILLLMLCFQHKLKLLPTITRAQLGRSILLGFLNPFLYYLVLFKAYSLLPAQVAQPLNYIWPIVLVLLAAIFLGQKLHWYDLLALLVSFTGVTLISSQGNKNIFSQSNPLGVVLALSSSIVWATFWIVNMQKHIRDEVVTLFLSFAFASIFCFIAMIVRGGFAKPQPWQGILASAYIGAFEMGITFVLWLKALNLAANTAKLGNFSYLVPFVALIFISLVLNEKVIWTTVVGLSFIIGAILFQQYLGRKFDSEGHHNS